MRIEIDLSDEGELSVVFDPEIHTAYDARQAQRILAAAHRAVDPVREALESVEDDDDE